jgi:hypothetical protein
MSLFTYAEVLHQEGPGGCLALVGNTNIRGELPSYYEAMI